MDRKEMLEKLIEADALLASVARELTFNHYEERELKDAVDSALCQTNWACGYLSGDFDLDEPDDSMDGDWESGMASAGMGMDESYGSAADTY